MKKSEKLKQLRTEIRTLEKARVKLEQRADDWWSLTRIKANEISKKEEEISILLEPDIFTKKIRRSDTSNLRYDYSEMIKEYQQLSKRSKVSEIELKDFISKSNRLRRTLTQFINSLK